ncbi:hypothetical protein DDV21_006220 [Streptococcus chenjunshii]|uniref:Membrane protein 6-pyruvoyl-tetrahydropterin synthase-related domain-containing protein n=1 Tax=Streptococcus chenjunshii TaxID=2173853 RepID=A0A372KPX4_9STRE|nr:hypothetical protein [Streptococcus chenjunshii]AXQ78702.1 hypothetical protein DDV21_006220 [Streptococcus chenjunshii]RFU51705.1 hypothetical protein DDV22_02320 [Streptococcus chenjunshii]RFU54026.1 hypothetical protein DDV23_00380 [Streptococcus chenjunshii]
MNSYPSTVALKLKKILFAAKEIYRTVKERFITLPDRWRVVIISFLIALLYIGPIILGSSGGLYGDDLHFHIDRVRGLANIWQSPVNFQSFYKVGLGINFFYPYLTYYPYYLLYAVFRDFYTSWIIYLYFLTSLTYLIAYFSSFKILASRQTAHLFALFYTFAAYRLGNFLIRFAAGELVAITFLPLVFCGLYLILRGSCKRWYYLSFGLTLIIYSHILSFVLTAVLVAFIYLTAIWFTDKRLTRSIYLGLAGLAALAMGSFQFFPMLEQLSYQHLNVPGKLFEHFDVKPLKEIISFALSNNLYQHTFGLAVLLSLFLLLVFVKKFQREDYYILTLTLALIILETPLGNSFPVLGETIQFMWRLNAYITLLALFLITKFLGQSHFKNHRAYLILLIFLMFIHNNACYKTFDGANRYPANPVGELSSRNNLKKLTNSVMMMDYANHSENREREIYDMDSKVHHRVFISGSAEQLESKAKFTNTYSYFTIDNPAAETQNVDLPLFHYKGQVISLDGKTIPVSLNPISGSAMIQLPPGMHEITATYQYTPLAKTAFLSSLLSLAATLLYVVYVNSRITFTLTGWKKQRSFIRSMRKRSFQKCLFR